MGNFNKFDKNKGGGGRFGGGGGHFGGGQRFGGHSDGPRQMFPATCGKCGRSCEVPFKPTGDRPVLCNDCFKGSEHGNKFAPKSFGRDNRDHSFSRNAGAPAQASGITKAQFDALAAKVDKILSILSVAEIEPSAKVDKIAEKSKKEYAKKEVKKVEKKPVKKAKAKKK